MHENIYSVSCFLNSGGREMRDYMRMISVLKMVTFETIDGKRLVSTIDGNVRGNVMGNVFGNVEGRVAFGLNTLSGVMITPREGKGAITMEEVLKLVTFNRDGDVQDVLGDVLGNVMGTVFGNVEGSVRGTGGCHVMGSIGKLLFMPDNNPGT